MTDEEKAVFRNLSVFLEKTIDTVLENQRFLMAVHKSLADQLPEFEETCKRHLANPKPDIQQVQDQMKMWEAQAKKTLHALRQF